MTSRGGRRKTSALRLYFERKLIDGYDTGFNRQQQ
jgi:hypothetical protein